MLTCVRSGSWQLAGVCSILCVWIHNQKNKASPVLVLMPSHPGRPWEDCDRYVAPMTALCLVTTPLTALRGQSPAPQPGESVSSNAHRKRALVPQGYKLYETPSNLVLYFYDLVQWFSRGSDFFPEETFSNVWRSFRLSPSEGATGV